jgi:acyl-CoA thioesterase
MVKDSFHLYSEREENSMDLEKIDLPEEIRERICGINDAPFIRTFGIELVSIAEDGEVRVTMDVSDKHNALGSAHGGAVFTLADQAFAVASNLGPEVQVAMFVSMTFIRPARGKLEAVARKIGETKLTSVYEVKVFEKGELVAIFQGNGYKLKDRVR